MWPKLIAQLVELLPHVSRLVPMADRFFASRNASQIANEAAMAAMAEGVRIDLGQVTTAHASLYRQLQDQGAQIADIATDARRTRTALEGQLVRTAELEKQIAGLGTWIKAGIALLIVVLALLITILHSR